MEGLFSSLSEAVNGTAPIAARPPSDGAFSASSSVPAIWRAFRSWSRIVGEQGTSSGKRAFTIALAFSVGILITIALIGAITAALGRMLGDVGPYVNYALAFIFLLLGLHFLGVIPLPWTAGGPSSSRRRACPVRSSSA